MHRSDARRNGHSTNMILDVAGERQFTVRIAPHVYKQLDKLAKREKRSISAQAAYLIEQALTRLAGQQARQDQPQPEQ